MGLAHSPRIVTDNLIQCFDAGNVKSYPGSGSTWTDLSPRAVDGTIYNSPTFSSNNNGLFEFDGSDEYIASDLDVSWNNTNSVTISFFVKPDALTGGDSVNAFLGKTNWEWQFMQNTNYLRFTYWNNAGGHTNGAQISFPNFFTDLSFVNVTMVWNHLENSGGGTYTFYRNGTLFATDAAHGNPVNWTNASINQNRSEGIKIGGNIYAWGSYGYFHGSIGNVIIYDKALTATEVQQNYNAHKGRFGL